MSNYQDIYRDLPSRVFKVWERAKAHTDNETEDLSVTVMLMAAAAGLAMPLEDINIPAYRNSRPDHPGFDAVDQVSYQTTLQKFKDIFSQTLQSSSVLKEAKLARCAELKDVRKVGEYGEGTPINLADQNVSFAFSILRNALAHNNIVAFGTDVQKIEKLTFFSEHREGSGCKRKRVGWNVLTLSIESFEKFLTFWFSLVSASGSYTAAVEALATQDASSEA